MRSSWCRSRKLLRSCQRQSFHSDTRTRGKYFRLKASGRSLMVFTKRGRQVIAAADDPQVRSLRRHDGSAIVAAAMRVRIRDLRATDRASLEQLLRRVEVFEPHEIRVAMELVTSALGTTGDYLIYIAEETGRRDDSDPSLIVGYICHGHNPVTDAMHDVYWIAVDPRAQG